MLSVNQQQLLNAIKENNTKLFISSFKGNEDLSFGRFPILSLCYLYKANRIIKEFKEVLFNKIYKYKIVDEPFELYKRFKQIAGRKLRLYVDDKVVYPIEMFAILGKDRLVKKFFKDYIREKKIINNLKSIYLINNQKILIENEKIKIGKKPLTKYQLKLRKVSFCTSIVLLFIVSGLFATFNFAIGFGFSFSPYKVSSYSQLIKALSSSEYFELTTNIIIDSLDEEFIFSGSLDGNNHTIYIKNIPQKNIIKENKGQIKNLNIVYNSQQKEISTSVSLLVENNKGIIDNVNIVCDNLDISVNKTSKTNIYINALSNFNNGTIKNCSVSLNANVNGVGEGECYVSGIAGKNYKIIENCILKQNSSLITSEADVSGIVFTNELNAKILNCKNYATLKQTSANKEWSPNVSGIAMINYSNVKNCYNFGKLKAVSTYESEDLGGSIYLGGIVSVNYSVIEKCLNKGELIATSNRAIVYCGGINALSNYYIDNSAGLIYLPVIRGCGVECNIDVISQQETAYTFVGGIVGRFSGRYDLSVCGFLSNTYSLTTFTQGNTNEKYFVGSVIGLTEYYNSSYRGFVCEKVAVLNQENVSFQIGSYLIDKVYLGENILNISSFNDSETLKQHEVYWHE